MFQVNVVIGVSEWGEDALPGVVCSGETSFLTSIDIMTGISKAIIGRY